MENGLIFRAWLDELGEMKRPDVVYANGVLRGIIYMQGSGVEDRNSQMIFEDDIVRYGSLAHKNYIGVVKFGRYLQDETGGEYSGSNCIGFYIERVKTVLEAWQDEDDLAWLERGYNKTLSLLELYSIEVIGNIHENPELLAQIAADRKE